LDQIAIIEACKNKNQAAFRTLMEHYAEFAYTVAFRIVNDKEEAKDLVQETFITVWDKIRGFHSEKPFSNWLYRIIVNKCYDALRKNKKNMVHPEQSQWNIPELLSHDDPETIMDHRELAYLIRSFTRNLSRKQKMVFVLSDLQGLTHDEISEITGMLKTSVKSNLNHARKKIRFMLTKYMS